MKFIQEHIFIIDSIEYYYKITLYTRVHARLLKGIRGFREKRNRSFTYVRPRRNRIVYLPIPNIFNPRESRNRETRVYEFENKNNVDKKRVELDVEWTAEKIRNRKILRGTIDCRGSRIAFFLSPSSFLLQQIHRMTSGAPRTRERCEKLRKTTWQERKKGLLNHVRAKVLGSQSPTRAMSRSPAPTGKKARTFNPVFHG